VSLPADRLQENIEKLLGLLRPRVLSGLAPCMQWEYRVVLVESAAPSGPAPLGIIVSVAPVDVARCPFGPLTVQMGKGASGLPCIPVIGSKVTIAFLDGNPAKPRIVATDASVPTVPPPAPFAGQPLPLTVAGALTTFATGLTAGTLTTNAAALITNLAPLL
jgi:hypothetical protein